MINCKNSGLAYSLSAAAFLACSQEDLSAQSLFTDIIPDSHLYFNDADTIDLDSDGTADLVVTCWYWISYSYPPWINANLEILNPNLSIGVDASNYPRPYLPGSAIGSAGSFLGSAYGHLFGAGGVFGGFGEIDTVFDGGWGAIGDACLGYKMTKPDGPHFGWLRIEANYSGVYLTEFAYELTPAVNAAACQYFMPPVAAQAIVSSVECDTIFPLSGISDVNVNFIPGAEPASVSEYRLYLLRETDFSAFDTAAAMAAIDPSQYISTSVTAATSLNLASILLDGFGVPLSYYTDYVVVVLSIADGVVATQNTLSLPSPSFQKENSVGALGDLLVADVADFDNGADLSFSFDPAENEAVVEEYQLVLYPELLAVDLADLLSVDTSGMARVAVGDPRNGVFLPPDIDRLGNLIQQGRDYKVCLLAKGTSTLGSSFKCSPVLLSDPAWQVDGFTCERDSSLEGFGAYKISFNPAAEDSIALAYRLLLLRRGEALPSPYELRQLPGSRSVNAIFDGSIYTADLDSIEHDINGTPFDPLRAYVPIVLSTSANRGSQSTVSDLVLFEHEAAIGSYTAIIISGAVPFIRAYILPAPHDEFIEDYKGFVLPESSATTVDIAFALSLPPDRIKLASTSGSSFAVEFYQGEMDALGDPIVSGEPYRVFLLSQLDDRSCPPDEYYLTEAPGTVVLPTSVGLNQVSGAINVYAGNRKLFVQLHQVAPPASVEIFDVFGKKLVERPLSKSESAIDLSSYPGGIYLVKVRTSEKVFSRKIYVR